MTTDAANALRDIWSQAGCNPDALQRIDLSGADPVLPSVFKVGTEASATIGAAGLAASELWRLRTGRAQDVSLTMRAAAAAFRSERYLSVDDAPPADLWSPIAGFYRTGDGGRLWLANLTGEDRTIEVAGVDLSGASAAVLDEASFEACAAGDTGFQGTERALDGTRVVLGPYAVMRVRTAG